MCFTDPSRFGSLYTMYQPSTEILCNLMIRHRLNVKQGTELLSQFDILSLFDLAMLPGDNQTLFGEKLVFCIRFTHAYNRIFENCSPHV